VYEVAAHVSVVRDRVRKLYYHRHHIERVGIEVCMERRRERYMKYVYTSSFFSFGVSISVYAHSFDHIHIHIHIQVYVYVYVYVSIYVSEVYQLVSFHSSDSHHLQLLHVCGGHIHVGHENYFHTLVYEECRVQVIHPFECYRQQL